MTDQFGKCWISSPNYQEDDPQMSWDIDEEVTEGVITDDQFWNRLYSYSNTPKSRTKTVVVVIEVQLLGLMSGEDAQPGKPKKELCLLFKYMPIVEGDFLYTPIKGTGTATVEESEANDLER